VPVATNTPSSLPPPPPPAPVALAVGDVENGLATWYGKLLAGHKTASGERFDPSRLTAAHKTLPLGTWVDVRRAGTNKVVRVRINDRGPFGEADRIIDLSRAAFEHLGKIREGVIPVEVHVVSIPTPK
jgi:rare lipoprotein A